MRLRDILREKGHDIHSIAPTATLQDVVNLLVRHNCGSLLVVDERQDLRGIITERDILRATATVSRPLPTCVVCDHMSVDLLVANPDNGVDEVMGWMTNRRVRHLPVVEETQLVGVISIGDIVKAQHQRLSVENHYLKNYIQS